MKISEIFLEAAEVLFLEEEDFCCDAIFNSRGGPELRRRAQTFFEKYYSQKFLDEYFIDVSRRLDLSFFMEHNDENHEMPEVRERRVLAMLFCAAISEFYELITPADLVKWRKHGHF